jgi:cobalt-zinc-cadmium efflux system protein
MSADSLRAAMREFPQVRDVHDLHLWTLTGRDLYLSAHIEVEPGPLAEREVVTALARELSRRHGVDHITLQSGLCGPEDGGNAC